jgi:hypothetical protein
MNYWLWVAKSDAYVGEIDEEGLYWGDCGGGVEPGDLVLIYRKSPYIKQHILNRNYSLIECLARVISLPEANCEIKTERRVRKIGHCCEYEILHKFDEGLKYAELTIYKNDIQSALTDWDALKLNFNGMYFPIDENSWNKLDLLLREKNINTYHGFEVIKI